MRLVCLFVWLFAILLCCTYFRTGKEFVSWYQGVRQQDHCTDEKLLLSEDVSVHVPTGLVYFSLLIFR